MTVDREFLKRFTEAPSVGTACAPALHLIKHRFGDDYNTTRVDDGFWLFQKKGAGPEALRAVFVAHVDEVGGCVYGRDTSERTQPYFGDLPAYASRCWGNVPRIFADAKLQAFDYLAEDASGVFPISGAAIWAYGEERLVVASSDPTAIRPYRTVFTFDTETTFNGDYIEGKALDPRITTWAVVDAVRRLNSPHVAAMIVMAEECAMDVARKGVAFLQRHSPDLKLVVNADVPAVVNLGDAQLDLPAIRVFEGRNFIDPSFGIRTAERLINKGVKLHLTAARSGSQTLLFTPLANTISVALPSDRVHISKYRMSLTGAERCVDLLEAIGKDSLGM